MLPSPHYYFLAIDIGGGLISSNFPRFLPAELPLSWVDVGLSDARDARFSCPGGAADSSVLKQDPISLLSTKRIPNIYTSVPKTAFSSVSFLFGAPLF